MKYILILLLAWTGSVFGQHKLEPYIAIDGREYNIEVDKRGGGFTLWIDAPSVDALWSQGGIKVSGVRYADFVDAVKKAGDKLAEWSAVAEQNNVTEMTKDINVEFRADGYFKSGKDWHFDYSIRPRIIFHVMEIAGKVRPALSISTGELQSSTNQFIKSDGFMFIFYTAKDVAEFLDKISMPRINAALQKESQKDLFKE